MTSTRVAAVVFPSLTQLDLTAPVEIFSRMPDTQVVIVGASLDPVRSDSGLRIVPDAIFRDVERADVLFVPGGPGVDAAMENEELLAFVRHRGRDARWVTSVCTGALVLGAAGLLRGFQATTHWLSVEFLAAFGATHVDERVVIDRNRITGGGVTAGIDFALRLAAELHGKDVAHRIQLTLEYDPSPPDAVGSPRVAPKALVDAVRSGRSAHQDRRRTIVARVASANLARAK